MGNLDVFSLAGRTALVTGAGSGIGAAVASAYAAAGAAVLVTDLYEAAAEAVAKQLVATGAVAESHALDVRDRAAAGAAAAHAAELGGGTVHVLINNAGAIAPAMFPKMTEDAFRLVVDIHLTGSFTCAQAVLPYLPTDGTGRIASSGRRCRCRPTSPARPPAPGPARSSRCAPARASHRRSWPPSTAPR